MAIKAYVPVAGTFLITSLTTNALCAATPQGKETLRHSPSQKTAAPTQSTKTVRQTENPASPVNEQVVVTGTHSTGVKARQSISPIDIITATQLQRSGAMNVADALARLNPSITISAQGRDTEALTSQIRLRGLSPNQTLVLIDGARRHSTANMIIYPGPQQGSTPVDLNMIPASAIDHIEILRDGAAAMYGADAIAGVVNIILKKKNHGMQIATQTGANAYDGSGWNIQQNINSGFKIGSSGFFNISGQYYHTDHAAAANTDVRTGTHNNPFLSSPEETRGSLLANFGYDINDTLGFFGNITYAHRHAESYQYLRVPSTLPAIYPYGFVPSETIDEDDYAATLGLKGQLPYGVKWRLRTTYGADQNRMSMKNTANLGYYAQFGTTPTDFLVGNYRNSQWTNDLDFSKKLHVLNRPIELYWGGEYRLDMYRLSPGEPLSYSYGGSNGQPGLMPQNAGNWSRDVWAGYIDIDTHPVKKLDVDIAGRFEHYTDFGDTESGKIAARYDFTSRFGIRATISNGFRAPTLAEEHFSTLGISPSGASALLPANSASAKLLGGSPLKPERSTNASGGFYVEPIKGLHVTADVYQINLRDRIVGSGNYNGPLALQAISMMGADVPTAIGGGGLNTNNVTGNYFSNAASTRTQGVDITADYRFDFHQNGLLDLNLGIDLNRTRLHHLRIDNNGNPLLSAQGISYLTTASPRSKIILTAHWEIEKWDVTLRQTRWGQTTTMQTYQDQAPASVRYSNKVFEQFVNTPRWTTDIEVGYRPLKRLRVALGSNNIFNVRPRRLTPETTIYGVAYYDKASSQVPMFGGYYYLKGSYDF
ncbi:TonB-dependent receptor plug domain-containing protein [Acetobacter malorum]|nr:TonB-dependent receptor [Acetobacter malorum]KXV05027.1 TonB-dependent receptor [Acetobacter malorum]